MEESKTYRMEFICDNCGNRLSRDVERGRGALGAGGVCDYCGATDHGGFRFNRPLYLIQAEGMRNVFGGDNK